MKANLVLAWLWILLGFVGGSLLGLGFHRENWLGGYASHQRRLYRLGHISFFGLAIVNLLFYFTAQQLQLHGASIQAASWGFVVGAITMPVCCVVMAHSRIGHALFAVPVSSLIAGGLLTFLQIISL